MKEVKAIGIELASQDNCAIVAGSLYQLVNCTEADQWTRNEERSLAYNGRKIQPDSLISMSQLQVTIAFQDPELDDEDLQADVECLLPQIREIDGIEAVGLVPVVEIPTGTKAIGGIVVGAAKFAVDNSKILQGLVFIGGRLVNGKTIKATFKAPDGREFSGEAGSRSDFEYLLQQAEEFFDRGKQP